MKKNQRKKRLIEPRLQLHFAKLFVATVGVAVLVQVIVLHQLLNGVASSLPRDGLALVEQIPSVLLRSTLFTLALLAPLTIAMGIHVTFKIVGPVHRFRIFLKGVASGEERRPCVIRKDDELQDLCELLNEATAPLREVERPASDRTPDERAIAS